MPTVKGVGIGVPETSAATEKTDVGLDAPVEFHTGEVEWTLPIRIPAKAELGNYQVEVLVGFLTCDDKSCDAPSGLSLNTTVEVAADASTESVVMLHGSETVP